MGALDRGRDRSATRLEVIFCRKGFLPMLDPSNLTRRKAYKTRVQGIWRCVENVSINCTFFKTKWLRMYLLNLEFKTQIHVETFSRKFMLQTWQSWHFLTWDAGYWGWRSEAKMDQKGFFYKIIWSKLCLLAYVLYYFRYFTIVFAKRTPELARTNRIWFFFSWKHVF